VEEAGVPGENHQPWAASRVHPFCNLQSRARTHIFLKGNDNFNRKCDANIYRKEQIDLQRRRKKVLIKVTPATIDQRCAYCV
jgi:hypothetical protein